MAIDPDPVTRAQLSEIIDTNPDALQELFAARLQFGTAGIRGRMGPGPGQLNRVLVRQVTAGLGAYLLASAPDAARRGVVVGGDARRNSDVFARDVAGVLGAMGFVVHWFAEPLATPNLSHAVTHLGAAGGVMVTASHNPPADNGYKVYWGNGAQIVPPHDAGISAAIDRAEPGAQAVASLEELRQSGHLRPVPPEVSTAYLTQVLAQRVHPGHPVRAVYTAMHGVGYAPLRKALAAAGHAPVTPVIEQVEPDGAFPTVAFPNPEEKGALDLAKATANASGADVIIAHDPDADRLAVAVPDAHAEGGWRQLTGNEVGLLLAHDLLSHGQQAEPRLVANTIVSSPLLGRIAEGHGARHVETLTGFKWIANAAIDHLAETGGGFVVGFEEALGYSVGPVVRDKDGVSAALVLLDLAGWCKSRGTTLAAHLDALFSEFGLAVSGQRSVKLPGAAGRTHIEAVLAALRADPPTEIGGLAVLRVRDVHTGRMVDCRSGERTAIKLPRSNVLMYDLEGGSRVIARPSGTEPKIKFYVDVIEAVDAGGVAAARARATSTMDRLAAAVMARTGLA
jgi:phosphomannomutase